MATLIADTVKARANFPVAFSGDVQVSTSDTRSVEQAIAPATSTDLGTVKIGDNIKNDNGEISIDNYVEVSGTKPTDGAMLWLDTSVYDKSGEENKIAYDNYSTDEIVVGKWIDGKPIYRKVIQDITSKTMVTIDDIDEPINITWRQSYKNGNVYWNYGENGGDQSVIYYIPSTKKFNVTSSTTFDGKFLAIFEYTKTIDAPDSFDPSMLKY